MHFYNEYIFIFRYTLHIFILNYTPKPFSMYKVILCTSINLVWELYSFFYNIKIIDTNMTFIVPLIIYNVYISIMYTNGDIPLKSCEITFFEKYLSYMII